MSILVVGSVALDSIQTPFGQVHETLGGAATYFATVASLYGQVNLVGVVGADFPHQHITYLAKRGVDVRGLQVATGKTFRWSGRYDLDLSSAQTLSTELNVFADFRPVLPEDYCHSDYVFLANIDPDLQMSVLDQVRSPRLTALDTMNYWINTKREALTEAIKRVDIVLMNEAEARQYANTVNLVRAAQTILALGPQALVVKKGEYGAVLFSNGGDLTQSYFFAPAYPLDRVADPTGAGDTFAGGFIGYLARAGVEAVPGPRLPGRVVDQTPASRHAGAGAVREPPPDARQLPLDLAIRQAIVHGSIVASFTVEGFGLDRLYSLTLDEVRWRYEVFRRFTSFEEACPWLGTCERLHGEGNDVAI